MTTMGVTSRAELIETTLLAATRSEPIVPRNEKPLVEFELLDGMSMHRSPTYSDDRGKLAEIHDVRWDWHPDPLIHAYYVTWHPGYAKGWALHKETEDRYYLIKGEVELVLYDVRPLSSTLGQLCRLVLTDRDHFIVNIPTFVWHGSRNLGSEDAYLVNFKSKVYDHADPDKYRLPLDTDLIPYSFGDAPGW